MEFWRNLKPIEKVFQPDALPEVYTANAATDDERYYVPFTETVSSRPLWISPSQNKWCDILMAKAAGLVNRHYHPHEVFAYTISGKWGYLEHDWVGDRRRLHLRDAGRGPHPGRPRPSRSDEGVLHRQGPLVWLDDKGEPDGYFDVHQYIALCKAHYDKVGLGAALIDKLYR